MFLSLILVLISDFSLLKSIQDCFLFTIALDRMNYSRLAPPSVITLTQNSVNCSPYFQKPYTLELEDVTQVSYWVYNEVTVGQNCILAYLPKN